MFYAGSETRTRTGLTPPDFESGASTNSAIPAPERKDTLVSCSATF